MKAFFKKYLRFNSKRITNYLYRQGPTYHRNLARFRGFLAGLDGLPILIPVFNNHHYLENMLRQLEGRGLLGRAIIFDNKSDVPATRRYLREIEPTVKVVYLNRNVGPRFIWQDKPYYDALPATFCLTDPDLAFNPDLPADFIAQLEEISETHQAGRAGFALDISDRDEMIQQVFQYHGRDYHIWDWEGMFWTKQVGSTRGGDPIFAAAIDTTFAVHNKKFCFVPGREQLDVRVGGRFVAKHLPWYRNRTMPADQEEAYRKSQRWSFYHRHFDRATAAHD
jgi:hypothetical protein